MPTNLLGLVLFAAATSPGFLFLRAADRRRPARTQTPLRETAEMFVVGSTASLLALSAIVAGAELFSHGVVHGLLFETSSYFQDHAAGVIAGGLGAYVLACAFAVAMAWLLYGEERLTESSAWFESFRTQLPSDCRNAAVVTTKSGHEYRGFIEHYTADDSPVDKRELVLLVDATLSGMPGGYAEGATGTARVLISGGDISTVELFHVPLS